ncbi:hypothetical protein [Faecalicoccus pleomorphus]|nr:hypothetical protein [Faecalicoccus pleomorphus]
MPTTITRKNRGNYCGNFIEKAKEKVKLKSAKNKMISINIFAQKMV